MSQPGKYQSLLHVSNTQPKTQADRLPEKLPDGIQPVPERLKGREDYLTWRFEIHQILKNIGLQDMIDKDLSHPNADRTNYWLWHHLSINIQFWLASQLSDSLKKALIMSPDAHDYADEAYEIIKSLVLGHGHMLYQITYFDLIYKRRSDYSTVEQYVEAFKHAYTFAKEFKVGISPYCGLLHLLKELESDLPTWVSTVECNLPDNAADTLQEKEFLVYCRTAIEQGNKQM